MRRIAVRMGLVLLACASALAIAEGVLRVSHVWIGRHSDTMFTVMEHHDRLGWRMRPRVTARIDLVDTEGVEVRANSAGFWDREFSEAKDATRCRVAFFGDSFTWGFGVRDEERFTALLGARSGVETLNLGMPGFGTDQALLTWREIGRRYRPDVAVLTVYENDFRDNVHVVRFGRRKPYFELGVRGELTLRGVPVDPSDFWTDGVFHRASPPYERIVVPVEERRSRVLHWAGKNSDLARLLYTGLRAGGGRADAEAPRAEPSVPVAEAAAVPLSVIQRTQAELLTALVAQFAEEVRAAHAGFIVVLAGKRVPEHAMLERVLAEARILMVDQTTGVLEARLAGTGERVYWPYNRHWTPAAHRAVAGAVGETIRADGACFTAGRTRT